MKNTRNKTFSIPQDVAEMLKIYARKTRQSESRAVSMLILEAAEKNGITIKGNNDLSDDTSGGIVQRGNRNGNED